MGASQADPRPESTPHYDFIGGTGSEPHAGRVCLSASPEWPPRAIRGNAILTREGGTPLRAWRWGYVSVMTAEGYESDND